jgi:hypothetical protein
MDHPEIILNTGNIYIYICKYMYIYIYMYLYKYISKLWLCVYAKNMSISISNGPSRNNSEHRYILCVYLCMYTFICVCMQYIYICVYSYTVSGIYYSLLGQVCMYVYVSMTYHCSCMNISAFNRPSRNNSEHRNML